jgi:hypothetical protein
MRQNRATPRREEIWLDDFLESLSRDGINEVTLYRIEANGNHRRIASGPVELFTEPYVQQTYRGGEYLVRSRLNGRWYRSKSFSVADPPTFR